ncbi:RsiW-degrading membrane proteinase PrsW (M82 family), partial [Clostridium beijerinckii]|nr:RsiW-degrading membrane proteinase PrsW (M82 family) [Clostridium beijerinckii]
APRNINIFDVVKIFFFGGVFSLLITMILSRVVYVRNVDYIGAIMIGIIEEICQIHCSCIFFKRK